MKQTLRVLLEGRGLCGVTIFSDGMTSPHFSPAFYCGTALLRIDCVALDLGAQRTASTLARPNLRAPCHYAPLWCLATKSGEKCGLAPVSCVLEFVIRRLLVMAGCTGLPEIIFSFGFKESFCNTETEQQTCMNMGNTKLFIEA